MTNEELDALVQELLGKQVCTGFEQTEPYTIDCVYGPDPVCQHAAATITTLRAQLSEMREERDYYLHKLMQANDTFTEMHLEIERLRDSLPDKGVM